MLTNVYFLLGFTFLLLFHSIEEINLDIRRCSNLYTYLKNHCFVKLYRYIQVHAGFKTKKKEKN